MDISRPTTYGIDVDGVLANFIHSFCELLISQTREDRFPTNWQLDPGFPCTWHFPQHHGYSNEQVHKAWEALCADRQFWNLLHPHAKALGDLQLIPEGEAVYFITARSGRTALHQTQTWLKWHIPQFLRRHQCSVLITTNKGAAARALKLDFYIDDYHSNVNDVVSNSPNTLTFLLNKPYNVREFVDSRVIRVDRVQEALARFRGEIHE